MKLLGTSVIHLRFYNELVRHSEIKLGPYWYHSNSSLRLQLSLLKEDSCFLKCFRIRSLTRYSTSTHENRSCFRERFRDAENYFDPEVIPRGCVGKANKSQLLFWLQLAGEKLKPLPPFISWMLLTKGEAD